MFVEGTSLRELLCLPLSTRILLKFSNAVVWQEVTFMVHETASIPRMREEGPELGFQPKFPLALNLGIPTVSRHSASIPLLPLLL